MERDGNICSWFENGRGSCFLNGSRCDSPFSCEGCKIQCERIFKKEYTGDSIKNYKPSKENKVITKLEAMKKAGIGKGDMIADWFIPYYKFDITAISPSDIITNAHNQINEKFKAAHYNPESAEHWLFQNVNMLNQDGVYIVGVIRKQ